MLEKLVVLFIVLGALFLVFRHLYGIFKGEKTSSCGCSSCDQSSPCPATPEYLGKKNG